MIPAGWKVAVAFLCAWLLLLALGQGLCEWRDMQGFKSDAALAAKE